MGNRIPGPTGRRGSKTIIDSGTKVRSATPLPGPSGGRKRKRESRHDKAKRLVREFRAREGPRAFSRMSRSKVARGLLRRIEQPSLINQRNTQLCGPASVIYSFASRRPVRYVRFVIELFETGKSKFGKLKIEPSDDCKTSRPRKPKKKPKKKQRRGISDADWIPLASLRDNSNLFLSVENSTRGFWGSIWAGLEGVTTASQIIDWFEDAGFTIQSDEASTLAVFSSDEATLEKASLDYNSGDLVIMCLDPDILTGKSTTFERHWVALTGLIVIVQDEVIFNCFTWGSDIQMRVDKEEFLNNFYGYISVRF